MINLANIKKHEPYDLYIGRENRFLNLPASKWGNPNPLKKESDRPKNLLVYRHHILHTPELLNSLHELDDLTLGCYCSPKPCHGGVLKELRHFQKHDWIKLFFWLENPHQLDDEEYETPTKETIQLAIDLGNTLSEDYRLILDGDAGIAYEKFKPEYEAYYVRKNNRIEFMRFQDHKIVERKFVTL